MPSLRKLTVPAAPCVMLVTALPGDSKLSFARTLNVIAVSSLVETLSATISATGFTLIEIAVLVVTEPSVVVTLIAAGPL